MTTGGARARSSRLSIAAQGGSSLPLIVTLFAFSGALSLVYEILWLRSLILVFGATTYAVSAVLTAFMGGLALGSFLFGRHADTLARPGVVYGVMEIGIGAYALLVPTLFGLLIPLSRILREQFEPSFGALTLLRFAVALFVLLVPTTLMGGTLPILSRFVAASDDRIARGVGLLYALNTGGAVVGTFAAGFWLLPTLGMTRTLWIAAAGNLVVGGIAVVAFRRTVPPRPPSTGAPRAVSVGRRQKLVLGAIALSGAAAMVFEVAWARVVGLVIGGSVYAFATVLTTFLVGLALGAAWVARIADRRGLDPARLMGVLLAGVGLAAFATLLAFNRIPYVFAVWLGRFHERQDLVLLLRFGVAFAVMFLPTLLLGGVFPAAVRACTPAADRLGATVGRVYAVNTMGTILGSGLAGFVLLPAIGVRATLLGAIVLELLLGAALLAAAAGTPRSRWVPALAAAGAAALLPVIAPPWNVRLMNSGMYLYARELEDPSPGGFRGYLEGNVGELLYARDGATASVVVFRDPDFDNIAMTTNGKVDASSRFDLATQILSGHLPLLLAPDRRRVLVVGWASGITVGSALTHPIERLTAVEIEEAVVEASEFFREHNNDARRDPRTTLVIDDARNFLLMDDALHDVIISEPSNPWITVASNLFTREAWEIGRRRLAPGGVFCQWIQLYGITPADLQALLRTFHQVFPEVLVFTTIEASDLMILGSDRPLRFDLTRLAARMREVWVAADLARVGIRTPADLLSHFDLGTAELERFIGDPAGPINTDDNARIEFATPKSLLLPTGAANAAALAPYRVPATTYLAPPLLSQEVVAELGRSIEAARARWISPRRAGSKTGAGGTPPPP